MGSCCSTQTSHHVTKRRTTTTTTKNEEAAPVGVDTQENNKMNKKQQQDTNKELPPQRGLTRGGSLRQNLVQQRKSENPYDRYEVVKQLGVGSMGSVCSVRKRKRQRRQQCQEEEGDNKQKNEPGVSDVLLHCSDSDDDNVLYAMKNLRFGRMTKELIRELNNEIEIVSDLDHPGIVKFYQVYRSTTKITSRPRPTQRPQQQERISIIMEYCSGGDLHKRDPYTEESAKDIVHQVLSAVAYMHSRGYVHRDIKFENIMFESDNSNKVKIIDFGLSCRYNPDRPPLHKQVGTIQNFAPEVFSGQYTSQCDLWSVGVVAYQLLCSRHPFGDYGLMNNIITVMTSISQANYTFTTTNPSQDARQFCMDLLKKDPDQRLTAHKALQHAWFNKDNASSDASTATTSLTAIDEAGSLGIEEEKRQLQFLPGTLLTYAKSPLIQKIGSLLIAHKLPMPEQVKDLRNLFERFDTDGTGIISFNEFQQAFRKLSSSSSSSHIYDDNNDDDIATISEIFDGMDAYHDGQIAYTEFLAATLTMYGYATEERILDAFQMLDNDDTGYISAQNLRELLGRDNDNNDMLTSSSSSGSSSSSASSASQDDDDNTDCNDMAQKIIDDIDVTHHHEGKISYDEFLRVFQKRCGCGDKVFTAQRSKESSKLEQ